MIAKATFKIAYIVFLAILTSSTGFPQHQQLTHEFTRQDTLRGSITTEREWWDLNFYDLNIKVDISTKSISGTNLIRYKVLDQKKRMQIDLQPPMMITRVEQAGVELDVNKEGNAWFITLRDDQLIGSYHDILVFFKGTPHEAENAPWDGGVVWNKDDNGKPFISTACQGDGASIWWPCKDHMYDEPDSMQISITCPDILTAVANGKLVNSFSEHIGEKTFVWFVCNPINNYGVNMNIGDYAHFAEVFKGEKGELDCNYYVLEDNLMKAKEHFKQVPKMLEAFEYWFGPYPFYKDGYKLVEVPYVGMEHQSSVSYGNHYQNGYLGRDLSSVGWGMKFDYIIIHESGHEWFANNITYKDIADMWIHESFTAYSECLFVDYYWGKKAGYEYIIHTRNRILNDVPVIGYYDVNNTGSVDMYYKGANMLHTIRFLVNDDDKWRAILRGMNKDLYHQTVTSKQIEEYLIENTGLDLQSMFDQYLKDIRIPILEYTIFQDRLMYRWSNCVEGFNLPVKVYLDTKEIWLKPTTGWSARKISPKVKGLIVDKNFYVASMNIWGE